MEQDYKRLTIMLGACLGLFILPLILIAYEIIAVPENMVLPIMAISILFGILYYVVLGILASKKNRSVIKWVGISIIFSPFGHIVSFPLMLLAKPLPKSEEDA
ncbi:MAG: hypothetical protein HOM43_00570 [Flavobacteriales bacterium]|nr:hypothetical protein [Flavobacteriales bacterium]